MTTASKRLCAGTLSDSSATLYTAPASSGNYTIIKSITICNKDTTGVTVDLLFNDVDILYQHPISGNTTITIPYIDQIIQGGETIKGYADTSSVVTYYISGKEIT